MSVVNLPIDLRKNDVLILPTRDDTREAIDEIQTRIYFGVC